MENENFSHLYDEVQDITNRAMFYAGQKQLNGDNDPLLQQLVSTAVTFSTAAHQLNEHIARDNGPTQDVTANQPTQNTMQTTQPYEFDEWSFIERYLADYSSNREVAITDDICCVLDGSFDEDKEERLEQEGYFSMTDAELREELKQRERHLLETAFNDYIFATYGQKD